MRREGYDVSTLEQFGGKKWESRIRKTPGLSPKRRASVRRDQGMHPTMTGVTIAYFTPVILCPLPPWVAVLCQKRICQDVSPWSVWVGFTIAVIRPRWYHVKDLFFHREKDVDASWLPSSGDCSMNAGEKHGHHDSECDGQLF
jgi:hypothetical protein